MISSQEVRIRFLFWITIFAIMGFCTSCWSPQPTKNFKVDYHAEYSSSGGDRFLDIVYTVRDGVVVSCEGTYSFPPSSDQRGAGINKNNTEQVDIQKLLNRDYNVPIVLFTSVAKNQKMGDEVNDGNSMYRYRIILK